LKMLRSRMEVCAKAAIVLIFALLFVFSFFPEPDLSDAAAWPHRLRFEPDLAEQSQVLRPLVGILTQPDQEGKEYIAASYVKYAEAAGARVIPLRYWWSEEQLKQVFQQINGILLPGGGASLDPADSKILRAATILWKEAEAANEAGKRFPIWGTCLGWELISVLAANDYTILDESGPFLDANRAAAIKVVNWKTELFRSMDTSLKRPIAEGGKMFFFSHEKGVTPEKFHQYLGNCWQIVALGRDAKEKTFVAAAESLCRPYFGVQFHPEKAVYEWFSKAAFPHDFASTEVVRHFISLFSAELRRSRPSLVDEQQAFAHDIHQFPVITLGDQYFYQVYVFDNKKSQDDAIPMNY